jgi:hypothetical protein
VLRIGTPASRGLRSEGRIDNLHPHDGSRFDVWLSQSGGGHAAAQEFVSEKRLQTQRHPELRQIAFNIVGLGNLAMPMIAIRSTNY